MPDLYMYMSVRQNKHTLSPQCSINVIICFSHNNECIVDILVKHLQYDSAVAKNIMQQQYSAKK